MRIRMLALWLVLLTVLPTARGVDVAGPESDDAFLERLERAAFDYFWLEASPANGLVRDWSRPDSKCSIAAVGFGLSAINLGIEHGWISRADGRARVLTTLQTFAKGRQGPEPSGMMGHRGWFYYFLEMDTGQRAWKCELSSIDTALLLAGVLDAQEFFSGADAEEARIRTLADQLVAGVDWAWMANGGNTFSMGWHPASGFITRRWVGYDEGMILYLLALGAPAAATPGPQPPVRWEAWTQGYQWRTNFGFA